MIPAEHFKRSEFECHCGCGADTVDAELLVVLEDIRNHFGKPVSITSGYRCLNHNRSVGSNDTSQHPLGRAADIKVQGIMSWGVYQYLTMKYPDTYGIGLYDTFVHVDTRKEKARW